MSAISLESADGRLAGVASGPVSPLVTRRALGVRGARAGERGLDWFSFFLADIQTGFGPFVAVYLAANHWPQFDIGLVLTAGGLVALASQIPAGVLIDTVRSVRLAAAAAVLAICASALMLATWPIFGVVLLARGLHAAASCVLGLAIAAISLGLVGHAALGERLGRNARFASIGNGGAAVAMGLCGYLVSSQSVFFLTAALAAPAILALARIPATDRDQTTCQRQGLHAGEAAMGWRRTIGERRLLVFAGCMLLFQLANAAMLPLVGGILQVRSSEWAPSLIGACILVPQIVVAGFSPWVGRVAEAWGRRPLLQICFAALIARGLVFALATSPSLVVAVQVLDGVSATILAVTLPLVVADITGGSGRFNLALGIVGSAVAIGAALSTTVGGYVFDQLGASASFVLLASVGGVGLALAWLLLPETRPRQVLMPPGSASARGQSAHCDCQLQAMSASATA